MRIFSFKKTFRKRSRKGRRRGKTYKRGGEGEIIRNEEKLLELYKKNPNLYYCLASNNYNIGKFTGNYFDDSVELGGHRHQTDYEEPYTSFFKVYMFQHDGKKPHREIDTIFENGIRACN